MRVHEACLLHCAVGRAVLTITNHAVNAPAWPASHVLCEQSAARPRRDDRRAHRRSFSCSSQVAVDGGLGGDHHQLLRVGNRFAEGVRAAPTNTHRIALLATTVNGQNRKKRTSTSGLIARVRKGSTTRERSSMPSKGSIDASCVPDGKSMRPPSRNCPGSSARRHRQGPKAARMRGRSEAQRLARCRAQMQHLRRDGRRVDVIPTDDHRDSASQHRNAPRLKPRFQDGTA